METGLSSISFEYNWDSKLRSATIGSDSISIKYDPLGNRVLKNSTISGNQKYIVDISGKLPTILCEIDTSSGSLTRSYIYSNSSEILCQQDHSQGLDRYFYINDRLGSVRLIVNDAGGVNGTYTYMPFGSRFASECSDNVYNPFGFTGQWFDDEIGQYYLRARMYDPNLMRFTGRDPLRGDYRQPLSLHKYLYCFNDPLNNTDATGESARSLLAPVIAGHAAHNLAIAVVAIGVAQQMDLFINIGILIDQSVAEIMTMVSVGWGFEKAVSDIVVAKGGRKKNEYRQDREFFEILQQLDNRMSGDEPPKNKWLNGHGIFQSC